MERAQILEAISSMTVLELSQLIKDVEEKFGVSAAAAVAVAAPAAGAAAGAAAEEQTEFTVVLADRQETYRCRREGGDQVRELRNGGRVLATLPPTGSRKSSSQVRTFSLIYQWVAARSLHDVFVDRA